MQRRLHCIRSLRSNLRCETFLEGGSSRFYQKNEIVNLSDLDHFFQMPIIFEQDGFKFFFYSNDHEPIHVHVRYSGGEAVFNVNNKIELMDFL